MKWLMVGDLHFGEKNNSEKFNNQILDFFEWLSGFESEVDYLVQFGDWFHNRNKIDVNTLCSGILGAKMLSKVYGKDRVFALVSNHDIYYRDRLDVSSMMAIDSYVTVVDEIKTINDILFVPWITDGEVWDSLINMKNKPKTMFGHLELSGFMLNDGYEMEHGYSPKQLRDFTNVFSGHYHSYQKKENITYLGTPYPITMNEANEKHGVFIYDDVADTVEFFEYDKVKVISINYTDIETIEDFDPESTTVRIEFPDDLEDETIITDVSQFLSEKGFTDYKIKHKSKKLQEILSTEVDNNVEEVENIDQVVSKFLSDFKEIGGIDKERLKKWYAVATEKGSE